MNNRGYTLLNMLLTLMILASMLTMTLKNTSKIETDHLDFINEYLTLLTSSLTERKSNKLYDISFNSKGHVNGARTLNFNGHKVVVHLGNGYLTYE